MADQVELAPEGHVVEVEGQDLFELAVVLAGAPGDHGDAQPLADHLLDGLGGAHFHGDADILGVDAHLLEEVLRLQPGAAAGLPADEGLLGDLPGGESRWRDRPGSGGCWG